MVYGSFKKSGALIYSPNSRATMIGGIHKEDSEFLETAIFGGS